MLVYDPVDLRHHFRGAGEGRDHAAIVKDVVIGQDAAVAGFLAAFGGAVLEPFLGGLIAADMEVPGDLRDALEPASGVYCEAAEFGVVFGLVRDTRFAAAGEADAFRVFQDRQRICVEQVERDEFRADRDQCLEQRPAAGQRDARKVVLQIIGIARAIGGRMQHRIDIVEQVARAEALAPLPALTPLGRERALVRAFDAVVVGQVSKRG